MTNETTGKKRNPNLVFAAMAKGSQGLPDATQALWDMVKTGNKIGDFEFIRASAQSFSTAKARNMLTAFALQTDAGKLLFIDSDVVAIEDHIRQILSHDEKIVGGVYPRKEISLQQHFVCNFTGGPMNGVLAPCLDIGAGFLCIDLAAVEEMIRAYPETRYLCEDDPWRGMEMHDLWSEGVVCDDWNRNGKDWPRYLTEDFYFCWRARRAGFPIWADTICTVGHIGQIDYIQIMRMIQDLTAPPAEDATKGQLPQIER